MSVKPYAAVIFGTLVMQGVNAAPFHTGFTQKAILDLAAASRVAQLAQSYASTHGWPCAVAIVDDGGWVVLTTRMDGAPVTSSVDLAQGKARTSALFKRPSDDLEKVINNGRQAAITAGLLMMKGGQPIRIDGQVVGAIGISADTPAHDDEIALAALQSLLPGQ